MSRRLRLVPEPPERSPERPGPGPVPPQVLRSLDLAVMRRVESLIPGEHMTPQVGGGTDLMMIRPYRPGDRVSVIFLDGRGDPNGAAFARSIASSRVETVVTGITGPNVSLKN